MEQLYKNQPIQRHVCLMSDFLLAIGSSMYTISKKLAKREKYFGVASGRGLLASGCASL